MTIRPLPLLCLLLPLTAAPVLAAQPAPVSARYACSDGTRLTATFSPPGAADGFVLLRRPGSRRPVRLPQGLSADGGRYVTADQEFWIKGRTATYTRGGTALTCHTP